MTGTDGAATTQVSGRDTEFLPEIVRSLLQARGGSPWTVTSEEFWCRVDPDQRRNRPAQGWKLHVSATPLSAPLILHRCASVLIDDRASFKFAGTLRRVAELVDARYDRSAGGKFLTVYPDDDEQFRRLAERLHLATTGLPGPGILSDRQYRPDSLVHYRYGAFRSVVRLGNDGTWDHMLTAPDGELEEDRRLAWYSPPSWARSPLPDPPGASAERPTAVLLGGRYVVKRAIRHAYKGGVFLGTDQETGREVVVKEARRHVGAGLNGEDIATRLRHEAAMHTLLAPLGLSPQALAEFGQGGNQYLVQERIAGETLRNWVAGQSVRLLGPVLHLAGQLVAAVAAVHEAGLVLRDLNPNNLMVTAEGRLRLIDLETVCRPGEPARRSYTPGYGAPEVVAAPADGPAPGCEADLFSLGATLFHLVAGLDLLLAPDRPTTRPEDERRFELVRKVLAGSGELRRLEPVILGLLAEEPETRWSLRRVREFLSSLAHAPGAGDEAGPPPDSRLAPEEEERMITDGLAHLLAGRTPDARWLWPVEGFALRTDALNVQYGAAGVLGVLTAAAEVRDDARLRLAVAETAQWIADRLGKGEQTLPGLYFGRSGTAWALLDAARSTGDDALAATALGLARQVPLDWPNPDVCHGVAGAGLAQLHFWQVTGEACFRTRVVEAAERLVTAARSGRSGVVWPVPADFDSVLAGATHLGFGHGVAGVGTFLLLAGVAAERTDFVDLAHQAGDTLVAAARSDGTTAGWPMSDTGAGPVHPPYWCNGSSGVGTFLIRLWQATGLPQYRELAEQSAAEVYRRRWEASPTACHGLAGNADFLLDLAAALDDPRYHRWAAELVACAHARRVFRAGLLLVPDESLMGVSAGYSTGLSGLLGTLLRLRHGGPRMWLPDSPALSAHAQPPSDLADARAGRR
ncbi:class IV lanthionine synthetase LanL [Kitasatospora sp. MAP5-34]|uniref:class IV lanthionine synthetase LanL n=1 Tax=Kitasatospora sp. MAP5-34 TaxID=3035102 RepID=UPI0024758975|nr:class IV lanthionine synthetase LanL [Kitasatospora sp. MAP5-34]MDH6580163.1 hypothetical protein [Kitasatospora sp. MAP5-34]